MQKIKKAVKALFLICVILSAVTFSAVYIMGQSISESYKITRGDTLKIDSYIPVTAEYNGARMSQMNTHNVGDVFEVDLKIFGLIPFSTAQVEVVDEMYVSVLGNPFGMKIYTEGVLVIELSDVDTVSGNVNPAKKAGIEVGDYIISVNGQKITCNEDLSDIVSKSNGEIMNFKVLHNGKTCNCKVSPQKSVETGTYRIGIWVRDSSAGIGTLTF
ncbi:MAG: PDZ domain-containing protein, partial [Clostridia bacterium]|nr:PDZ domain-containing protein [Clostridia bacterium]